MKIIFEVLSGRHIIYKLAIASIYTGSKMKINLISNKMLSLPTIQTYC